MTKIKRIIPKRDDGPLDEQFDKLVGEMLGFWHVPGVAVAVVDGEDTWARGYGFATLPSTSVTPSTLFYTGSTTKAFTAAIMSLLVDDNETFPAVQWDTPISQLIRDDFVLEDEYYTIHITIEDALSHRTGLPAHDKSHGGKYSGHKGTVRDVVRSLRYLPLTAEPRTKFQYCNLMYVVASHIIEELTGSWLGDLMAKHIWNPLDMKATLFSTEDAKSAEEDLAHGYYYSDGRYHEVKWMDLTIVSGAGSVVSNVLDYAKWARALMNKTTPLSKAGREAVWRPRTLLPDEPIYNGPGAYALGWQTRAYHGHQYFRHSGAMNAFGAELILFPDLKFSVILFANTPITSNFLAETLAFHLIDQKLDVPVAEKIDWKQLAIARIEEEKNKVRNARKRFYPSLPSPIRPPTMSLAKYAGNYWHLGYRSFQIYVDSSSSILRADRLEVTWPERLRFEHVSGDYFLAIAEHIEDFGALAPSVYSAEFKIGPNGKPSEVGIGWQEAMEGKIWLKRM